MNATITTNHGTYAGRTVETIVHREYGRRAEVMWSKDANDHRAGTIVQPSRESYTVLASLISYEGRSEAVEAAADERSADGAFLASPEGAAALAGLDAEWRAFGPVIEDEEQN